jgi:hypothetical protein
MLVIVLEMKITSFYVVTAVRTKTMTTLGKAVVHLNTVGWILGTERFPLHG